MADRETPLLTAQWGKLVMEAEESGRIHLDEELESYLVFLLMRYHDRPEIAVGAMATGYLEGMQQGVSLRRQQMRDVGDRCLLYSGLFPRRARRRLVTVGYYVDLGRSAYRNLADDDQFQLAATFAKLAANFVVLMDTLQALRSLNSDRPLLEPLDAMDLWHSTGSRQARAVLESLSDRPPILQPPPERNGRH